MRSTAKSTRVALSHHLDGFILGGDYTLAIWQPISNSIAPGLEFSDELDPKDYHSKASIKEHLTLMIQFYSYRLGT